MPPLPSHRLSRMLPQALAHKDLWMVMTTMTTARPNPRL